MLFTVLTGIAIGAYVGAALFPKKGADEKAWIFPVVALVLLACGGFAAMGHLGRPQLMMNVLNNPGSSITMEGICTGIMAVIAIVDLVLAKQKGEANRGVRIVGAIAGLIFMCIVTSVYVKSYGNAAWMSAPTYLMFVVGDLALGALFIAALDEKAGQNKTLVTTAAVLGALLAVTVIGNAVVFQGCGLSPVPFAIAALVAAAVAVYLFTSWEKAGSGMRWAVFVALLVAVAIARYAFYAAF
jgi:DMSO reductase anchor subunit